MTSYWRELGVSETPIIWRVVAVAKLVPSTPAFERDKAGLVAASGAIAPLLWPLEIGNALLMAERRRRLTPEHRATLLALLQDLPITLDTETAHHAWAATTRLAERHALYDAATLECAARRRLPLATLDRPLATAATTLGLETLGLT